MLSRAAAQLLNQPLEGRPPLGQPPTYARTTVKWTDDPVDETVFNLVVDELRNQDGPNWILYSNDVQARAVELGLSDAQFYESMHVLSGQGRIVTTPILGGQGWMLSSFPDQVWLRLEDERGIDLAAARRELLALIVNDEQAEFPPRRRRRWMVHCRCDLARVPSPRAPQRGNRQ